MYISIADDVLAFITAVWNSGYQALYDKAIEADLFSGIAPKSAGSNTRNVIQSFKAETDNFCTRHPSAWVEWADDFTDNKMFTLPTVYYDLDVNLADPQGHKQKAKAVSPFDLQSPAGRMIKKAECLGEEPGIQFIRDPFRGIAERVNQSSQNPHGTKPEEPQKPKVTHNLAETAEYQKKKKAQEVEKERENLLSQQKEWEKKGSPVVDRPDWVGDASPYYDFTDGTTATEPSQAFLDKIKSYRKAAEKDPKKADSCEKKALKCEIKLNELWPEIKASFYDTGMVYAAIEQLFGITEREMIAVYPTTPAATLIRSKVYLPEKVDPCHQPNITGKVREAIIEGHPTFTKLQQIFGLKGSKVKALKRQNHAKIEDEARYLVSPNFPFVVILKALKEEYGFDFLPM